MDYFIQHRMLFIVLHLMYIILRYGVICDLTQLLATTFDPTRGPIEEARVVPGIPGQGPNSEERKRQPGLGGDAAHRFTHQRKTSRVRKRTPPYREELTEQCDYIAKYCHKTYVTGRLCARTAYYKYMTFKNYCMLDYVNCMEHYEMWQVLHMGQCYQYKTLTEFIHYSYKDDYFLDQNYVIDDQQWTAIGK